MQDFFFLMIFQQEQATAPQMVIINQQITNCLDRCKPVSPLSHSPCAMAVSKSLFQISASRCPVLSIVLQTQFAGD